MMMGGAEWQSLQSVPAVPPRTAGAAVAAPLHTPRFATMILNFANASVRLLLAPRCAACEVLLDRPIDGPVCDACWHAVARLTPPYCDRCGEPVGVLPADMVCVRGRQHPPALAAARSADLDDG